MEHTLLRAKDFCYGGTAVHQASQRRLKTLFLITCLGYSLRAYSPAWGQKHECAFSGRKTQGSRQCVQHQISPTGGSWLDPSSRSSGSSVSPIRNLYGHNRSFPQGVLQCTRADYDGRLRGCLREHVWVAIHTCSQSHHQMKWKSLERFYLYYSFYEADDEKLQKE